jgi:hypothetical protein
MKRRHGRGGKPQFGATQVRIWCNEIARRMVAWVRLALLLNPKTAVYRQFYKGLHMRSAPVRTAAIAYPRPGA